MVHTRTRSTSTGITSPSRCGSTTTPRPTCVTRSYDFEQAQDNPDAARDRNKSGDVFQIKHEYEFESDGPYTIRYYVPPTPEDTYFRDEISQRRLVNTEPHVISQHQRTATEEGEVHTTELRVGDLFRLGDRGGIWKFVGVSVAKESGHFNELVVFEPHDDEATRSHSSRHLSDYVCKTKSDFGQKLAPFKDVLAHGMGHVRIGTLIEPETTFGRPEVTHRPNHSIADPDYPNYEKGPMYEDGVQLKTQNTVPQSLR